MKALLVAIFSLLVCISIVPQASGEDPPKPNQTSTSRTGYIDCSNRKEKDFVPLVLKPCARVPTTNVPCGQRIDVFERQGDLLKITKEDGVPHYIESNSVSQKEETFVPFDAQSGIPDAGPLNCSSHAMKPPHAVYAPDPEYSDKALKAHIQGIVTISLTVGIDGKPRDMTVEKKLGYGLDEKAIEAVRQWRFQPATSDGKPVETKIQIEVAFRSINYSR
jgi:TonB family protein